MPLTPQPADDLKASNYNACLARVDVLRELVTLSKSNQWH